MAKEDGAAGRGPRSRGSKKAASPGLAARRIAVEVVEHVLKSRAPLDETLDSILSLASIEDRDGGLVRAIATTSFRHLGSIRAALGSLMERGLPAKSGSLGTILITGAAQILDLDVPDHAAVDLAVRLTRDDNRTAPYGALVNAVLRRIAGEKEAVLAARDPLAGDTPDWLRARWIRAYGADNAAAIAAAHGREAALDLSVKAEAAAWAERVGAILLPTGSVRVVERGSVTAMAGFEEGAWWVQDAAAALPARILAPQPGERVIDLCAAPGGKTAQLAAAGAQVVAVDRSAKRLERLQANMDRLGLAVETVVADALTLDIEPADAVLLDAPCSATGTLRRHPEIAWTKSEADLAKLMALQGKLLSKAAGLVKPGGRLVYCTCSLEPEEGESQIAAFLAGHRQFRREPIRPDEMEGLAHAITGDGDLRTLPSMLADERPRAGGIDGFFATRLVRER